MLCSFIIFSKMIYTAAEASLKQILESALHRLSGFALSCRGYKRNTIEKMPGG